MRRLPQSLGRLVAGVLALALATAVTLLASAQPAAAHGTLAMSTPESGATVQGPLTSVALYFTEKVGANAYFTVTAPNGVRVDNGWTYGEPKALTKPVREYFLVDGQFQPREYTTGFPAVVSVAHLPAAGQYSVSYLSVASDGDAVRGTMTFRYTGRATKAPQGWQPPTQQPDPALLAAIDQHASTGQQPVASAAPAGSPSTAQAAPAVPSDGRSGPGALLWVGGAVAVLAAVAGFVLWRRRSSPAGGPPGRARASKAPAGRGSRVAPSARKPVASRNAATAAKNAATAGKNAATAGTSAATAGGGRAAGGRQRSAAVPAARSSGALASARNPVVVEPAPAGRPAPSAQALATPEEASPADRSRPEAQDSTVVRGSRLTNTHLALLVGGLVVALLAGFGLARIGTGDASPSGDARRPAAAGGVPTGSGEALSAGSGHDHAPGTGPHSHPGDVGAGETLATGTTVSAGGYTLQPLERTQPPGVRADYRFRIVGTDRQPATRFAIVHEKPLHLIVVGRDLGGYQHLHPTMASDGTWSVPLTLARPGGYRVFADFSVNAADGRQVPLVLGVDHHVPGAYAPAALPPAQAQATAGPFTVSMTGTPTAGVTAPVRFQLTRTDAAGPVQPQRYLGAYGHLVVVREGDLGYVHVHPEQELVDGAVAFWLTVPSAGRYRAFFDFQVDGKVQTAEYTINLP
ncbi:copper resistance protein CopC [Micromonospora sp. NBC_00617]|uniref:copper resistance protein CopC n=1 Tax=Micromonospora sp. NBC_00617 TaxID=2903587 RepID=UPI0030E3F869